MNAPPEHRPLSRSTSRASSRTRGSTLSRQQSLIKKNIELQDLKPADVLIERFVAWKAIVKQLTAYFEGIADIENNTAKELTKLAGVIQVPFRAGNQFLGEGGLQDIYYDIRDKTRIIADQHADLGRTIDSSIVQHLNKLRAEIKAHIKNVQNDTGKLAASVARERELSTKLVGELANAVSTLTNTPSAIHARNDPYIANQAVARQLQHQVHEENMLQKSIVIMQQNSAHFEEGIVQSIQSAWQTFDEWQSRASAASQEVFRSLAVHMASLRPDHEWIQFAARSDHLLDPETPLRDPAYINYPLKDHHATKPIHVGHLERKKRFTRAYHEAYFVLTPSGFLHEFASSDPTTHAGQTPTFSLYLPSCTLGPASSPKAKSHKFHIEGRKDGTGTIKTGSIRGLLGGVGVGVGGQGALAWSFRARSHEDMMEWWNDVRELCARYLVASEQVERVGPVEDAVRSVGYLSEDEEGEEEEEEEEEEVGTADEGEADEQPVKHRRRLEVHDAEAERAARGRPGPGPGQAPTQLHPEAGGALHDEEDPDPGLEHEHEHEGSSSVEEEVDEHEHDHPHAAPEASLAGHAPLESEHDQGHEDPPVYAADKHYQLAGQGGKIGGVGGGVGGGGGAGGGGGGGGLEVGPNGYPLDKKTLQSLLAPIPTLSKPLNPEDAQIKTEAKTKTKRVPRYKPKPVLVNRGNSDVRSMRGSLGAVGDGDGDGDGVGGKGGAGGYWGENGAAGAPSPASLDGDGDGDARSGRRLSQRQMDKAPGREDHQDVGGPLIRQDTGGEGVDSGPALAQSHHESESASESAAPSSAPAPAAPYYARPDAYEESKQPTHAIHRAPTGGKVKYAPPPSDAVAPRILRGDSGMGVSAHGHGHGRPRSPPPPTSAKGKRASGEREKDDGHVEGYDLSSTASGDEGDRGSGTPSRARVDEVSSGSGGDDTEDDDHDHAERELKDVVPGRLLGDAGAVPPAAAVAHEAETRLGAERKKSGGAVGVDGDEDVFGREDDVGKKGGEAVGKEAAGGGGVGGEKEKEEKEKEEKEKEKKEKKTKEGGGGLRSWLFGD